MIIFMNYVVTINSREIYMTNHSITSINLIPPLGAGDEEEEKFFHLYLRRPRNATTRVMSSNDCLPGVGENPSSLCGLESREHPP